MKIEPFFHGYRASRRKTHGAGPASRLQALKMGLLCFSIANGGTTRSARFAHWLAIHGTPRLPPAKRQQEKLK